MGKRDGDFSQQDQAGVVRMMCHDMPGSAEAGFSFIRPSGYDFGKYQKKNGASGKRSE